MWLEEGLSLEQIGERTGRHPSTVSYWLEKHGLEPAHRERHAREVASRARRSRPSSSATSPSARSRRARSQLRRRFVTGCASTASRRRGRHAMRASERRGCAGRGAVDERCRDPRADLGSSTSASNDGASRCERCRSEAVSKRRRHVKAVLVAEAGGCCAICGYDALVGALQFHHVDPAEKSFHLSRAGVSALDRARARARRRSASCCVRTATRRSRAGSRTARLTLPTKLPIYRG